MDSSQKSNKTKMLLSVAVTIAALAGCTHSDQSTEGRDDTMVQNGADAEAAEARLANADQPKEEAGKKTEGATKTAAADKDKKSTKTDKTVAATDKSTGKSTGKTAKATRERQPASAGGGVYVVQVGAFKVKENAEKLEARLKTAGFPVAMHTIEHSKNGLLHLVQFEPVTSRAEAETVIEELQAKQDLRAQLVSAPH